MLPQLPCKVQLQLPCKVQLEKNIVNIINDKRYWNNHSAYYYYFAIQSQQKLVKYSSTFLEPFGGPRNSIFELSFENQSLEIALVEKNIQF